MLPVTIASISPKPRILLVEDESGIADTLQYVLDLGLPDPNGFAVCGHSPAMEARRGPTPATSMLNGRSGLRVRCVSRPKDLNR